ncbi:MAG: hypothetical protein EOP06_29515 [Proteobacteria bacterium]|nr:MAG: hypothetical protein EOP06_29515 [Pseudomonadota bacterium]
MEVLTELPRKALTQKISGTELAPSNDRLQKNAAVPQTLVERLSSLEGKVQNRPDAGFRKKFVAKESFRGLVAGSERDKFRAVIKDRTGDKYEYVFEKKELPEQQQEIEIDVGTPVVIHIGFEYRGSTKMNVMKVFLANYEKSTTFHRSMISRKVSSWNF